MRPAGIYDRSYSTDNAIVRTRTQWMLLLGALALLFTFPLFYSHVPRPFGMDWLGTVNYIAIIIVVVMGLQIVTGYCGQISLGHAAMMAVGAYVSVIISRGIGTSWSFWVALPCAGIVAGLIGIVFGAPSLRIKGFYLALATLAAHYIIYWLALHLPQTGGTAGLTPPWPQIGGFEFDTDFRLWYIIMPVMILMTFFARNLVRTRTGRAFVAIRDNDIAAETMGVNVWRYKALAFFIGCFYAGIGGALFVHWMHLAHPEQFLLWFSLWYLAMVIIGGGGTISGVFFGVTFLKIIDEFVVWIGPKVGELLPFLGGQPGYALGYSAFGLVLILFLIFEPRGLAHRWELFKASYRLYPFPY